MTAVSQCAHKNKQEEKLCVFSRVYLPTRSSSFSSSSSSSSESDLEEQDEQDRKEVEAFIQNCKVQDDEKKNRQDDNMNQEEEEENKEKGKKAIERQKEEEEEEEEQERRRQKIVKSPSSSRFAYRLTFWFARFIRQQTLHRVRAIATMHYVFSLGGGFGAVRNSQQARYYAGILSHLAQSIGDESMVRRCRIFVAYSLTWEGRLQESRAVLENQKRICEEVGDEANRSSAEAGLEQVRVKESQMMKTGEKKGRKKKKELKMV